MRRKNIIKYNLLYAYAQGVMDAADAFGYEIRKDEALDMAEEYVEQIEKDAWGR